MEPVERPPEEIDWPLFPGYCFARFESQPGFLF